MTAVTTRDSTARGGRHLARRRLAAVLSAILLTVAAAPPLAAGQEPAPDQEALPPRAPGRPPRLELTVLGGAIGGADLGQTRASVLTNQVPASGTTALFTTSASIAAAPMVEGRVGVRLGGRWLVEGGLAFARPEFRVEISGDVEGAPDVTAISRLSQYIADGALQYRWHGRRVSPFVTGGAGYVRQLDEPRTTGDTGVMYFGGAGVRVALAPGSRSVLRHLAVRGDARLVWLRKGLSLNEERGPTFAVAAGLSAGW